MLDPIRKLWRAFAAPPVTPSASVGADPPLVEWPLPSPVSIDPSPWLARRATSWDNRSGSSPIQVFPYPFDESQLAEAVTRSWASPLEGDAVDGRYCEVTTDKLPRYITCRDLVSVLSELESSAGTGMSRLRWVALDCFGYAQEASELSRQFETELGAAEAITGMARIMLGRHPDRSRQLLAEGSARGCGGAAFEACQARVAFACGLGPEGVAHCAAALASAPDPRWKPADHLFTWGLLHASAIAARFDSALKAALLDALRLIHAASPTAHRALACATLAELAGDMTSCREYAAAAVDLADSDHSVRDDAKALVSRADRQPLLASLLAQTVATLDTRRAHLGLPGWSIDENESRSDRTTWRSEVGDWISLAAGGPLTRPDLADRGAVRRYGRDRAERVAAGLVEADVVEGQAGPAALVIWKARRGAGFTFTGTIVMPLPAASLTWTVVADEGGLTGVREAVVTAQLMASGQLDPTSYRRSWASDPYDPTYAGVDRSTLRYTSDDPSFDTAFPQHPLSRVRRILRDLTRVPDLGSVAQS